jgi:hypothetical protein
MLGILKAFRGLDMGLGRKEVLHEVCALVRYWLVTVCDESLQYVDLASKFCAAALASKGKI